MGMYDEIITPELKCECGAVLKDWQSKDGPCLLENLHFAEVNNFYTGCEECSKWYEYTRTKEPKACPTCKTIVVKIEDYELVTTEQEYIIKR